jgi:hypothetical protein
MWTDGLPLLQPHQVNPTKVHSDVVVEALHLSLDELAQSSMKESRCIWVYDEQSFPEMLAKALRARRAKMSLPDRFKWARASNEINVESSVLGEVALQLNEVIGCLAISLCSH